MDNVDLFTLLSRLVVDDLAGNAACAEVDPELFFPEQGESAGAAKAVCARCEIREACLAYAVRRGEPHGVWGAASVMERRALARGCGVADQCNEAA
jgi:WhiB family redox-sensing transcriptional regulator